MRRWHLLIACATCAASSRAALDGSIFYISSSNPAASDGNPGTSPSLPWRTLEAAVKVAPTLSGGDQILLRGGDTFNQTSAWYLEGMRGSASQPVRIGAYFDDGSTVDRPRILRVDATPAGPTLTIADSSGVEVTGLEIVGGENGIAFSFSPPPGAPSPVAYDWFNVSDCWIHGVRQVGFNSSVSSASAAVALAANVNGSTAVATRVRLSNNIFTECDKAYSTSFPYPGWKRIYVSQVTLQSNFLSGVRFNSIFLDTTDHVLLQGNVMLHDKPDLLFLFGTTDVIIGSLNASDSLVGNEIGWRGEYTGQPEDGPDGCAIDFETAADGMTVRDNFIHHSWGAGIMVLGHSTTSTNLQIRDNIMLYNGCNQTRDDRGGMSFLHPNSSGVISGNVMATCPGTPLLYALANSTLDNWVIEGNFIEGVNGTVVPLPAPNVTWVVAPGGGAAVTAAVTPLDPPYDQIEQRLVYTVDGSRPTPASASWPSNGTLLLPPRATALLVKAFAVPPPSSSPRLPPGLQFVESPSEGGVVAPAR